MDDASGAGVLRTERLVLEPLTVEHADELTPILDDVRLHEYTGGFPDTGQQRRDRFTRQARGFSTDRSELWFNWVVRLLPTRQAIGTLQATVTVEAEVDEAALAWVVGVDFQRHGYATEAATAVANWVRGRWPATLVACIHPDHVASARVATALGLTRTDTMIDGEYVWRDSS